MSVNINTFKQTSEAISNRVQSGNTITPAQFTLLCDQAQMLAFEQDRLIFLKTGDSSDYLNQFLVNTILNPSTVTGNASYPSDFQHTAGVRAYYNAKERPVEIVESKAWGEVQASELMAPTRIFPKYTEFANEYRFLPKNIGIVMLDYFKRPVVPVWAYTIVNNNPVYTSTGSVDFGWDEFSFNRIIGIYLSLIGVNLQSKDISAFAKEFMNETKSLL